MGRGKLAVTLIVLLAAGCGGKGGAQPCTTCDAPPPPPPTLRAPWPVGRPGTYRSPIAAENARPGELGLRSGRQAFAHEIEAYADRVSARTGESVGVHANVDATHAVAWTLYRIGWYGGAGARRVSSGGAVRVSPQRACPPRPGDALVQCAWATAFQVAIDPDEVSGYHVVKLVRDDGFFTAGGSRRLRLLARRLVRLPAQAEALGELLELRVDVLPRHDLEALRALVHAAVDFPDPLDVMDAIEHSLPLHRSAPASQLPCGACVARGGARPYA